MATTDRSTVPALEVRRTLKAPPEKVYRAFTDPAALSRWFAPTDEHTVTVHSLEARVGGQYRIEMRHVEGAVHVVGGAYRELRSPARIVFTWKWEERPEMPDTVVAIDLTAQGNDTELVITHSLFDTDTDRDNHGQGWDGCLERLAAIL